MCTAEFFGGYTGRLRSAGYLGLGPTRVGVLTYGRDHHVLVMGGWLGGRTLQGGAGGGPTPSRAEVPPEGTGGLDRTIRVKTYAPLRSNLPSRGGGGGIPEPVHRVPPDASLPSRGTRRRMTTPPSPPSGLGGADGRHYHCGAHSLTHALRGTQLAGRGRRYRPLPIWGGPPAVFRNTGGNRAWASVRSCALFGFVLI